MVDMTILGTAAKTTILTVAIAFLSTAVTLLKSGDTETAIILAAIAIALIVVFVILTERQVEVKILKRLGKK